MILMKSDGDRNQEYGIGDRKKGSPCYKLAKNRAKLCPSLLWKAKIKSDGRGQLAEGISKQSVKAMAWFFLTAYSKM